MPDWPLMNFQATEVANTDAANSRGVAILAAASANTDGGWTVLLDPTTKRWDMIQVMIHAQNGTNRDFLVDIGIGAVSSEQVIIEDIYIGVGGLIGQPSYYLFPINIPIGSRLIARCRCSTASGTLRVACTGFTGTFAAIAPLGKVKTYGAVPASTGSLTIAGDGGTFNALGTWAVLSTATTDLMRWIMLDIGAQKDGTRSSCTWLLDIGVGSAGNEQIVVGGLVIECNATSDIPMPSSIGPLPVTIPAGSRLVARCRSSITTAGDKDFGLVLHGGG